MDFAKAFDKVPHKRLLYKMKYFGISEQIINWVKSFLSSRILNSTFRKYDIIKNTSHIWCPTVQFLDQYFF